MLWLWNKIFSLPSSVHIIFGLKRVKMWKLGTVLSINLTEDQEGSPRTEFRSTILDPHAKVSQSIKHRLAMPNYIISVLGSRQFRPFTGQVVSLLVPCNPFSPFSISPINPLQTALRLSTFLSLQNPFTLLQNKTKPCWENRNQIWTFKMKELILS